MSFFGKEYTLVRQENLEAFLSSIAVPEDRKQAQLKDKPTVQLVKNGDTYTLITSGSDQSISEVGFKSGVEFGENVRGNTAKTTITVDGNTVTQVQKFESGITFTFKREFSDSEVVLTITSRLGTEWHADILRLDYL